MELLSVAKLRELKKVVTNYKKTPSVIFLRKMTAPSKMGRKHELNLI